ncbi:hypothetical protein C0T31_09895 [Dysgonamonadaceae bacterium]|nr:hypothetical protein C0T31_09895 [Dysgonamonadaceae bacterium]
MDLVIYGFDDLLEYANGWFFGQIRAAMILQYHTKGFVRQRGGYCPFDYASINNAIFINICSNFRKFFLNFVL